MNTSRDGFCFTLIKGCSVTILGRTLLAALVAVCTLAVPVTLWAHDRDNRDNRRHSRERHDDSRSLVRHLGGPGGTVAALQAQVLDLQNKVAALTSINTSVAALQAQVTDLQNKVAALAGTDSSLLNLLKSAQSDIVALQTRITTLESNATALQTKVTDLESKINNTGGSSLAALSKYVTVDPNPINGLKGPHVIFTGVNLHVRSGSGSTMDGGTPSGLGNLVVGYNEGPPTVGGRTGSHNIVGGTLNAFTSSGGLVVGTQNWIRGQYATVLSGANNENQGFAASILGGSGFWLGTAYGHIP